MFKNGKTNLVLCGFMGTGKTSIGKSLAQQLNLDFVDLDEVIEKRAGCPINKIFKNQGEKYFRALEKEVVAEYSQKRNTVVSTGGGVVIDPDNVASLKKNGILINLTAAPLTILNRTSDNPSRPLLNTQNALSEIKSLLEERASFYAQCDERVATDKKSIDELAKEIQTLVIA